MSTTDEVPTHPIIEGEGPAKCTWTPNTTEKCPHTSRPRKPRAKVLDTILEAIGDTPLVRLDKIAKAEGLKCNLYAKCEFFNAGGSVKDRIGYRMFEDAEESGLISPGATIIEPTSGNTGIGLALAAAIKGYRMIVTMPEKMSDEKVNVLRALGAEIIRTPNSASYDAPESHIGVAKRLNSEIPNSFILNQYDNPSNPMAHYEGTAEEILESLDNKVDMFVAGAGTGGTITGNARRLKEVCPDCIIVGVDPVGSYLSPDHDNGTGEGYHVEGIGYDFIPKVLERKIVDKWMKSKDNESFAMSRRLIREEGLLCGGSSGTNVYSAVEAARELEEGQNCVVILPDSVRNYMTKFLSDEWMIEKGFLQEKPAEKKEWWANRTVGELNFPEPITVTPDITCREAIDILMNEGFDQLPVVADNSTVQGVVTEGNLTAKIMSGAVKDSDPVTACLFQDFKKVDINTTLGELSVAFDKHHFVLVISSQKTYSKNDQQPTTKDFVIGVCSRIDLLKYVVEGSEAGLSSNTDSSINLEAVE